MLRHGVGCGALQYLRIFLRHLPALHVFSNDDVDGFPFAKDGAVRFALDAVPKMNDGTADSGDVGLDEQLIVVPCGRFVAYVYIDDRDSAAFLDFHPAIVEAMLPHQFDSANFEPDEVVRVVDDAHLVRFGVANADAGLPRQRRLRAAFGPVFNLGFGHGLSLPKGAMAGQSRVVPD